MGKGKGKGKGKGRGKGEISIGESNKAASNKILLMTFLGSDGSEFYSVDLETEKVMKLPVECLGKETLMCSVVPFGSFIYLIGSDRSQPSSQSLCKFEPQKENESGFVHDSVSSISYVQVQVQVQAQDGDDDDDDITTIKEGGEGEGEINNNKAIAIAKWKAGPPPPVPPRCPDCCLLSGNIYVFTFCGAKKAQFFDPKLNQWALISPPRGRNVFHIRKPVLVDHSNNRLLVFFIPPHLGPLSLYAYYPTAPPLARWDLVVPQFHTSSFLFAFDSGVIFSFVPIPSQNQVFTAFDVDSQQTLHVKFTSPLDQRLWFFRPENFSALLNLGNRILCLLACTRDVSCTPNQTLVFAIRFKIQRTTPTYVRITPFPSKFYSVPCLCRHIQYSAFSEE